jgi:hypothetical protein
VNIFQRAWNIVRKPVQQDVKLVQDLEKTPPSPDPIQKFDAEAEKLEQEQTLQPPD